jgi:hypothetical protein
MARPKTFHGELPLLNVKLPELSEVTYNSCDYPSSLRSRHLAGFTFSLKITITLAFRRCWRRGERPVV